MINSTACGRWKVPQNLVYIFFAEKLNELSEEYPYIIIIIAHVSGYMSGSIMGRICSGNMLQIIRMNVQKYWI